jgi:hypothetical protein
MKKTLSILFVLFAFSCNKEAKDQNFKKPSDIDVSKIIASVIENDSLRKNPKEIVFINLKKADVVFSKSKKPYPPRLDVIYDFEIKHPKMNINNADLKYIKLQNKNVVSYHLNKDLLKEIIITDEKEIKDKFVYRFSFPIFTRNNNKAYVKLVSYISGNFLDCREYVLSKENENWKVIEKDILFSH